VDSGLATIVASEGLKGELDWWHKGPVITLTHKGLGSIQEGGELRSLVKGGGMPWQDWRGKNSHLSSTMHGNARHNNREI